MAGIYLAKVKDKLLFNLQAPLLVSWSCSLCLFATCHVLSPTL